MISPCDFPNYATLTPKELANILDLVAKVNVPIGVAITHIAPVLQRASMLASLPDSVRIGALLADPPPASDVPTGTPAQLELPLETALPPKRRPKPERTVHVH